MKLIKLSEEHYIVVDDSEIKEGDWMIRNGEQPKLVTPNFWWDFGVPYKKITHSTIPKGQMLMEGLKRLSIQEVKELLGEVDVEKKANEEYKDNLHNPFFTAAPMGYIKGYNQALEDNKEKKWTDDDIVKAIEMARISSVNSLRTLYHYNEQEVFKSLQPKIEWEVEITDGKLKLK